MDILIISPQSVVDVITNSSSELFVCDTDKSLAFVKEILEGLVELYVKSEHANDDEYRNTRFDQFFDEPVIGSGGHWIVGDRYYTYHYDGQPLTADDIEGKIILESAGDNTIPWAMNDFIEQVFNARRIHIG